MAYNPVNANGQEVMDDSQPVVIASNQSAVPISDNGASITVDGTVAVSNFPATQPVSGTVAVTQTTASNLNAVVSQPTATDLNATVSLAAAQTLGTVTNLVQMNSQAISMGTGVRDTGTQRVTIATNDLVPVSVSNFPATQPVSGSVSVSNFPATQPVSGTVAVTTLGTVTNLVQMNSQAISMGTGVRDTGTQRVTIATNDLVPVSSAASITGGVSAETGADTGTGTTTLIPVIAEPCQVYGWYFYNPNSVAAYIGFFNFASGGSINSNLYFCLVIPPVSGANVFGIGIKFTNGVSISIATTRPTGIVAMDADVDYNLFYKSATQPA